MNHDLSQIQQKCLFNLFYAQHAAL